MINIGKKMHGMDSNRHPRNLNSIENWQNHLNKIEDKYSDPQDRNLDSDHKRKNLLKITKNQEIMI